MGSIPAPVKFHHNTGRVERIALCAANATPHGRTVASYIPPVTVSW